MYIHASVYIETGSYDQACAAEYTCRTCSPDTDKCTAVPNPPIVHITQHGQVAGEANIMAEVRLPCLF